MQNCQMNWLFKSGFVKLSATITAGELNSTPVLQKGQSLKWIYHQRPLKKINLL